MTSHQWFDEPMFQILPRIFKAAITVGRPEAIATPVLLLSALSSTSLAEPQQPAGWQIQPAHLSCTYQFPDFVAAVDFVEQLVAPAERLGHHPDVAIAYNKVTVSLTTHDANGLTALDYRLAAEIDALAQSHDPPLSCRPAQ